VTCIRDEVHASDLIDARLFVLKKLENEEGVFAYNLGNGEKSFTLEFMECILAGSQLLDNPEIAPRRPLRQSDFGRRFYPGGTGFWMETSICQHQVASRLGLVC